MEPAMSERVWPDLLRAIAILLVLWLATPGHGHADRVVPVDAATTHVLG
jgi:hypothetical protein